MLIKTYKRSDSYRHARNKIDLHLRDVNHTISEDDIKNIGKPLSENKAVITKGVIEFIDAEPVETDLKETKNPWTLFS